MTPFKFPTLILLLLAFCSVLPAQNADEPPNLADFTWYNQGTHIAAQNASGTLTIAHPGAAGVAFNWGMLLKPLPLPPYTIVVGATGHINSKAASLGICLYESGSGRSIVFSAPGASDSGAVSYSAWKMNSSTSYAGLVFSTTQPLMIGGLRPKYVRIKDDGTYRSYSVSQFNSQSFFPLSATVNSDFITPTHAGYCLRGTGDGVASQMTVFHEKVTSP